MKNRTEKKWKYKYKNLFFLCISVIIAGFILQTNFMKNFIRSLGEFSYLGAFASGIFYTYGLTSPVAIAVLAVMGETMNFLLVSIIAALGSVVGDYFIFKFVKDHLLKEIEDLFEESGINFRKIRLSKNFRAIVPIFAGFIIASPLPDEIGVALLGISEYHTKKFFLFSYILNFLGILLIVCLGIVF
ncbi:MAG: hypothetical protein QXR09_03145 [Candidatus Aenigmatarchaeota archaeon]